MAGHGGGGGGGRRPRAVFMAFGTQGDVFPIAALAAAFAREQEQYAVVFITHSAHQSLSVHLAGSNVRYMPVSSPPVLAAEQAENISCDSIQPNHEHESFLLRKKAIQMEHRKECLSFVEEVFGNDTSINGDFIVINFFALVAIETTDYRFILFSSGYQPLDSAIQAIASSVTESSEVDTPSCGDSTLLFNGRLFCFSGWLFPRCAAAIHHAGSGSTAAALLAEIPQVVCPFLLDQFYWAERLHWLGVAPEPLQRQHLIPDSDDTLSIHNAADVLLGAIRPALSPEIKAQATRIADKLSYEDGVGEALRILKERVLTQNKT
ncbi:hypothetical protein BAE44_0009698 [Dichanthelium oligosanthes]|uniref:Erythromycin biosynthesis protein CIII-like C-terminal domain-containing protein n=1 Tax=Dichanthelium oligosanthes TaxID=888268 RepID=A0A1E5VVX7_9POAL|nr:hypothetical protein BAE44_0009698 [Dichanthelium oligosanthes]